MTPEVLELLGSTPVILSVSEGSPGQEYSDPATRLSSRAESRDLFSDPNVIPSEAENPPDRSIRPGQEHSAPGDPSTAGLRPSAQDDREKADLRAHLDSLIAQAEALRREQPDFDLDAALRDPAFLRLTAPALGVGVREAWYALHREELEARAAARSRELLARAVSGGRSRPREGGGLESAALTRSDYRSLSREARERLKQDILEASARGEKLYP